MDAVIKKIMPTSAYMEKPVTDRPSQQEVETAVRTLLRWTGDNPDREGLVDTPKRVAKAFLEMFNGYDMCPAEELGRTFEEVAGYDDLVLVRDIQFHSHGHARHPQAGLDHADLDLHGYLQRQCGRADSVHDHGARRPGALSAPRRLHRSNTQGEQP